MVVIADSIGQSIVFNDEDILTVYFGEHRDRQAIKIPAKDMRKVALKYYELENKEHIKKIDNLLIKANNDSIHIMD